MVLILIIANEDGRLQMFVVGTNNALYYKTQTSSGSRYMVRMDLSWGVIKADTSPVVARNNDGRLQVFVVGTNNALYYKTQTSLAEYMVFSMDISRRTFDR